MQSSSTVSNVIKGIVKPYQGKINSCVVCNVTPKEGDELFMQNIGDDTNKNWLVSPHEECFKKLQADPTLKNKKYGGKAPKTPAQVVEYKIAMSELAWKYAKEKAEVELPSVSMKTLGVTEQQYNDYIKKLTESRRILASVFYYGIMGRGS